MRAYRYALLLRLALRRFREENAGRLAAAIAYHSVFSLAPLFMLGVAVSSLLLGQEDVRTHILDLTDFFLGEQAADAVEPWLFAAYRPRAGIAATVVGLAVMLWGSSRLFVVLQDSLNTIYHAEPRRRGLRGYVHRRFIAALVVIALLAVLLAAPALSALVKWFGRWEAAAFWSWLGVETLLFAALFRFLPDVRMPWRPVLGAAALTALSFNGLQQLFGWYLSRFGSTSAYGAAGSMVALLLWVHATAQIMLFGASLVQAAAAVREEFPAEAPSQAAAR